MTTTTTTTLMSTKTTEIALVGNGDNLVNIEYSTNSASIIRSENLGSSVAGVIFGEQTNKAYISTVANLYSYNISYYVDSDETQRMIDVTNADGDIISTYRKNDNLLWALQSYNGKVAKMNPSNLSIIKTYNGIDAPFKIRYSAFHNAYFVAGSHILWKIDSLDVVTSVYEINNYILKDFDVSENGLICMIFRGVTNDIIRIVKGDQYAFVLDNKIGAGTVAFCKYCNKGRFYVLAELNTGSDEYSAVHYVFNSVTNQLSSMSSENARSVTTTTTTLGTTTKAVKVISPSIGNQVQIGQEYDIKWISSKGITDSVKIELYKGSTLYSVLSNKVDNTGIFSWSVSSDIEEDDDYGIKITWLAASSDSNNYDSGGTFSILKNIATTTTTTTTRITEHAIGIDYGVASDWILIILASGLYGIFELEAMTFYGLLQLGISNPTAFATRSMVINGSSKQSKFRIFVGSQMYCSDRWDSGIVESSLKSCYYGGGSNLVSGQKYYVHIQSYSEKYGWSEIQIQEFVMLK